MFFPLYVDLSKKNILVVGGGAIATRRIKILLQFAGEITVVAPEITEEVQALRKQEKLCVKRRYFEEKDLDGKDLVLAATDKQDVNAQIAALCRERQIPVNVSTDQTLCDFQFPSVVIRDDVVIGINASGKQHGRVKETRQAVEEALGAKEMSLYE